MSDVVRELRGEVAWLRLNRPERLNAYDGSMADQLAQAVDEAKEAGVIVITGSGRAFCAGGYLGELTEPDEIRIRELFSSSLRLFDSIRMSPRPVIAAVNGAAFGGGNELVVACDIAIAARSAAFGQTGPRIGSAPVLGGTNMLAACVGEKRAKEIAMMCRRYTAQQALELGWINEVVPDEDLETEVSRWAQEFLSLSPRYLEIAKISSNVWWNTCRESFISGIGMLTQAIGSADMREGARAFLEKRPPRFAGRERDFGE